MSKPIESLPAVGTAQHLSLPSVGTAQHLSLPSVGTVEHTRESYLKQMEREKYISDLKDQYISGRYSFATDPVRLCELWYYPKYMVSLNPTIRAVLNVPKYKALDREVERTVLINHHTKVAVLKGLRILVVKYNLEFHEKLINYILAYGRKPIGGKSRKIKQKRKTKIKRKV